MSRLCRDCGVRDSQPCQCFGEGRRRMEQEERLAELEERDECPMGCGQTTEDPYGGPCAACWAAVA